MNIRIRNHAYIFWSALRRKLTDDDGINFPFNLQGAVIAAEDVSYVFQLCLLNHQVVFLLKVFLQQEKNDYATSAAWCQLSIYLVIFYAPLSISSPQAPAKGVFSGRLVEVYSRSQASLF